MLQQLSGDKCAGVYRCRPCGDTPDTDSTSVETEGYYWGGLTSGTAARALWLAFLPFVLINLAHWMLPPSTTGRCAPAMAVRFLRLLGLVLTLSLMVTLVQIVMDIVGWQCASVTHCASHLGPANFLLNMPRGRQLMFTAIPVALTPLALVLLGRSDPAALVPADLGGAHADEQRDNVPPHPAVTSDQVPLAAPGFWNPDESVKRLCCCHVMAWLSGLGALTLAPPIQYLGHSGMRTTCWALLGVQIGILSLSVAATWSTRLTGRGGRSADWLTRPMRWMQWVTVAVLLVTLASVAATTPAHAGGSPAPPTAMPWLEEAINGLLAAEIVLLVLLFVVTARCMHGWRCALAATLRSLGRLLRPLRLWRREYAADPGTPAGFAPSLKGFGAPFVATIAVVVGGGFSTGMALWAARWVGAPVRSPRVAACGIGFRAKVLGYRGSDVQALYDACDAKARAQLPALPADFDTVVNKYNADMPIIVPPGLFVAAIVFSFWLLILVALAAIMWLNCIPRLARARVGAVREAYGASPDRGPDDRASAVARAQVLASLTDRALPVLAFAAVAPVAVFLVTVLVGRAEIVNPAPVLLPGLSLCVAVLSATAGGVVSLALLAFRDREKRRIVGVLWDVMTFWPQANHPLTPPCYGERVVPELVGQLSYLAADSNRSLVLAAHSQGSIIAAATILQASNAELPHIGILTFGCPLRRLYARYFPAYFGYNTIEAIHSRVSGRWINLWAPTDPIGSWLLNSHTADMSDPLKIVDFQLPDVASLDREDRGNYPPICGHTGFRNRAEYHNAVRLLMGAIER